MLLFMMGNSEQILLKKLSTDEIYVLMSFLYSQSLVAFLSPLKVQSTKRSNSPKVAISYEGPCRQMGDRYLWIHCSATKTPLNDKGQCDARADGQTKGESKVKTI